MKTGNAVYIHETLITALQNVWWVEEVLKPKIGTFGLDRLKEAIEELEEEYGLGHSE